MQYVAHANKHPEESNFRRLVHAGKDRAENRRFRFGRRDEVCFLRRMTDCTNQCECGSESEESQCARVRTHGELQTSKCQRPLVSWRRMREQSKGARIQGGRLVV